MRIPRIYCPQDLAENTHVVLEEEASHHLLNVLRMDVGRALRIFNGDGKEYNAEIQSASKKTATISVVSQLGTQTESPLDIQLAIALSKGDRFELVLQKSTELGVKTIIPLFTERTDVKLKADRIEKKMKSWKKIIIGACEQSGRTQLPVLEEPSQLNEFISTDRDGLKLVLHHRNSNSLADHDKPESLTLIIGPEGGLSEKEILAANKQGYANLALGPRVLRTETAPIAALAIAQQLWGDI
jgi:16S rRNA (uracil1498-N3)-methyltransferase